MTKLNSSSFIYQFSQVKAVNQTKFLVNVFNFTEEFTGNYLKLTTNGNLEDTYGFSMPPSTKKIRLDDYLIQTEVEKTLESSAQGAAVGLTVYTIAMIAAGLVFNKSLVQLWSMLDSI